jgi:hypothetical protein
VTMSVRCGSCGAPVPDMAFLCGRCTKAMKDRLEAAAGLLDELETTALRQARIEDAGGSGEGAGLAWNEHARRKSTALGTVVHGWVRVLLEDSGIECSGGCAGKAKCWACAELDEAAVNPARWLASKMVSVRLRDWAPDAADQVAEASRLGWQAVDIPEQRFFAGVCGAPLPFAGAVCDRRLWCRLDQRQIKCPSCKTSWSVIERREDLLRAADDLLAPAALISTALTLMLRRRVPASTLGVWAHRGVLMAQGEDAKSRKLYRVGDVLLLLQKGESEAVTVPTQGGAPDVEMSELTTL